MAYFSNSSEGFYFDNQCMHCKLYEGCPIAFVQQSYNYKQHKHKIVKDILDSLVSNVSGCLLYNENKNKLFTDFNDNMDLFD